jgi:hypothetical protein
MKSTVSTFPLLVSTFPLLSAYILFRDNGAGALEASKLTDFIIVNAIC